MASSKFQQYVLHTLVENAHSLWWPAFWPREYQHFWVAEDITCSFMSLLWQEQDHEHRCWSIQWGRAATLPWGSGQLQAVKQSWIFSMVFFCAAYTREEGCLGRGSHHPVTFTFFSWSPSIWGTSGSEEDGCETCRIPCQQQPRLRHWLTMNPAKLIFADYSLNQMNYLVTILKYQFKIHIKIET